ncbi:Putative uncharacterized protein [Taphrina deformans PYCC 5710]|uniref:Uncharacterized protein n=1 Tax=Taphrina deformans (strain PYCC 5710 / ATCC 11124 / CBS 356.35 / IMI 108563 / JCM 9778 / NBRC 8474) TaxID=1097556 RepID=R4XCS3_TAPDE|nr:Putative uncharacterized protein [Taphrina deformans PYCC 5710]|eukprot:CCG82203.1 Putative uncharacterized protein [Taphrina deformans PYCC 5710]
MSGPFVFRIAGSVLPTITYQVLGIGAFTTLTCCIEELTRVRLSISPILISTMGFIVGLTLSFRTTTAYQRWWEARTAWDRLFSTSRNLARLIWISVPEPRTKTTATTTVGTAESEVVRTVLMKKTAVNLVAALAVSLKNHLRDDDINRDYGTLWRRHRQAPRDAAPSLSLSSPPRKPDRVDSVLDYAGAGVKTTWFLFPGSTGPATGAKERHGTQPSFAGHDSSHVTLEAGLLPTEITFHLASYMERVRAENPGLPNYLPQNFNLYLNNFNDIVSTCERIRRTPVPLAYQIIIPQILWIFCLSLPFQLCGVLSWAAIPLCMVASAFLFSLAAIGTEIEDPFGRDANDLDLTRYCRALQLEMDVLTSIEPPNLETLWAQNQSNKPLWGVSEKTFEELAQLSLEEVRELLSRKAHSQSQSGKDGTCAVQGDVYIDRAATVVERAAASQEARLLDV